MLWPLRPYGLGFLSRSNTVRRVAPSIIDWGLQQEARSLEAFMKRVSVSALLAAEMRAHVAESIADAEWIEWVRVAVAGGVRCDVSLASLRQIPRQIVEVAPGTIIYIDKEKLWG